MITSGIDANCANHVFINCPFTDDFRPLFQCAIFTVLLCGFLPRSALEAGDGSEVRMDKITRLIRESQYSIHDLSAVQLDAFNELPRFNMPFELGMVIGSKRFGGKRFAGRSALIMEHTRYASQKCLSDIAGRICRPTMARRVASHASSGHGWPRNQDGTTSPVTRGCSVRMKSSRRSCRPSARPEAWSTKD